MRGLIKCILYGFMFLCVFLMVLLLAFFIAGDVKLFEWDSFYRFMLLVVTLLICGLVAGIKETI